MTLQEDVREWKSAIPTSAIKKTSKHLFKIKLNSLSTVELLHRTMWMILIHSKKCFRDI